MKRVAINGFGRIGRATFKAALERKAKFEIVAINDLTTPENLAYLLKYDTVYGVESMDISSTKNAIVVNGVEYPIVAEKDPSKLPWKLMRVDTVIESTGLFESYDLAKLHLSAGAKRVIISAPAKGEQIQTFVRGVNDTDYTDQEIISNASCTTNCLAPAIQVLKDAFGIKKSIMTTIHAYTATQKLVDGPDAKDFRRGRAAALSMSPSTTGAALATTKVIPSLVGKFDGISVRVPVACGSLSDITMLLEKNVTVEQVNDAYRKAAKNPLYAGILTVTDDPIVSADIVGNSYSSIIDLNSTRVVDGDLVKVLSWYDNEWGYSCRLVEMVEKS